MATHFKILCVLLISFTLCGSLARNTLKELRIEETNKEKYIRLGDPMQAKKRTDPSRVVQLSWHPRVFLYRDFLSEEECDFLISWVRGKGNYTKHGVHSVNFSITMDTNDEITKTIEERISAWTFIPKENSKSMNIQHFGPEDSTKKFNYFQNETKQVDQPLLATVILYLSNVGQGGQILFPQAEDKMWSDCAKTNEIFKPSKGNAIVFFNLHLNATPDWTSSHARCPVLSGDMWCATKFFYLKSVSSSEKDLIHSEGVNCTDEDENCPRWAATGECERNPVFMKGSPDYYGTCMKSCKAC